jgi:hypothetical protein
VPDRFPQVVDPMLDLVILYLKSEHSLAEQNKHSKRQHWQGKRMDRTN